MTTNADKDPQTHDGTPVDANADKTPAGNVSTGIDPNPSPWEETPLHLPVGKVLGSTNAKRTNNLIMKSERTHNEKVGVGALQYCDSGVLVNRMDCHTAVGGSVLRRQSPFYLRLRWSSGEVVGDAVTWRVGPLSNLTA
ncbi:hypothetical protein F2Q70_00043848 [Brassica cretica]|uniref:Uncharacterized protein n=1 Tax=Brassica cretica TaxID=69181 RepID=A0A8S9KI20_BRACR|nr:hypothetical protein F2Q70_00043848 [Brassica cretica]